MLSLELDKSHPRQITLMAVLVCTSHTSSRPCCPPWDQPTPCMRALQMNVNTFCLAFNHDPETCARQSVCAWSLVDHDDEKRLVGVASIQGFNDGWLQSRFQCIPRTCKSLVSTSTCLATKLHDYRQSQCAVYGAGFSRRSVWITHGSPAQCDWRLRNPLDYNCTGMSPEVCHKGFCREKDCTSYGEDELACLDDAYAVGPCLWHPMGNSGFCTIAFCAWIENLTICDTIGATPANIRQHDLKASDPHLKLGCHASSGSCEDSEEFKKYKHEEAEKLKDVACSPACIRELDMYRECGDDIDEHHAYIEMTASLYKYQVGKGKQEYSPGLRQSLRNVFGTQLELCAEQAMQGVIKPVSYEYGFCTSWWDLKIWRPDSDPELAEEYGEYASCSEVELAESSDLSDWSLWESGMVGGLPPQGICIRAETYMYGYTRGKTFGRCMSVSWFALRLAQHDVTVALPEGFSPVKSLMDMVNCSSIPDFALIHWRSSWKQNTPQQAIDDPLTQLCAWCMSKAPDHLAKDYLASLCQNGTKNLEYQKQHALVKIPHNRLQCQGRIISNKTLQSQGVQDQGYVRYGGAWAAITCGIAVCSCLFLGIRHYWRSDIRTLASVGPDGHSDTARTVHLNSFIEYNEFESDHEGMHT